MGNSQRYCPILFPKPFRTMKLPHCFQTHLLLLLAMLTVLPAAAQTTSNDIEYQKQLGLAFMKKIAERDDVLTMESGLQLQTVKFGTGSRPRPKDSVIVNFKGFTVDGRKFSEGEDVEFPLLQLIEGFREGLLLMSEGGRAIIVIPCELGYGDAGAEPDIPGGATLLFDVELVKVLPAGR